MQSNFWKWSSLALAGALTCIVGRGAIATASAEPQPQMVLALEKLEAAKTHLQAASHDKGGHRAKAVKATQEALDEVRTAIDYDNRH
jgi:hypothetical protein